jgi:hypothetical protein
MSRFNRLPVAIAAGLALAQPSLAAAQSTTDDGGWFADSPGAGPVVGVIALLGVVFAIMAITGDNEDDGFPASP